jgi:hypothetical protein
MLNYYPSLEVVRGLYNRGPGGDGSMMKMFGATGYGVRTPIYRL